MRDERGNVGWLIVAALCTGCNPSQKSATKKPPAPLITPRFEEVTAKAGLKWTHNPCRTGKKFLPETVGGGGGFLDYDGDGNLDILLINGAPLPGYVGPTPRMALYRNNGDGTFADVTAKTGLAELPPIYGMGAAVGDYDNDGKPDIFLTAVGETRLLHNEGGKFADVTAKTKTALKGFTTAATWGDFDRDGRLDLFVARYVEWTPETDLPCGPANARQYCAPYQYKGAPPVLLHQRGDGTFEDVSEKAGVLGHASKTLAVVPYDFNGDGFLDLYLANDTEPDVFLMNNGNGTFSDKALESGVAVGSDGNPTGSMGADAATPFSDGRTALAVGVFAGQQMSLFVAQSITQTGANNLTLFDNLQQQSGVAAPTRAMTTFGLMFADVDLDGYADIFAVNGHIDDDQAMTTGGTHIVYRQPPQLFQNQRDRTFREIAADAGFIIPFVGRGLAVGDYDNDGKSDFLVFENGGPVRLYHNVTRTKNDWLGVQLVGKKSPRDGAGAMVTLEAGNLKQTRCATTARSYLSVCDLRLSFGVPANGAATKLIIRWPSGAISPLDNPERNRYLKISEP